MEKETKKRGGNKGKESLPRLSGDNLQILRTHLKKGLIKTYGSIGGFFDHLADKSKENPAIQKLIIEYLYGKVPDVIEVSSTVQIQDNIIMLGYQTNEEIEDAKEIENESVEIEEIEEDEDTN